MARVATALVLIPFVVLAILWRDPRGVWGLAELAVFFGLREFFAMVRPQAVLADKWFFLLLGMVFSTLLYWTYGTSVPFVVSNSLVIFILLWVLVRTRPQADIVPDAGVMVLGITYVSLLVFVALLKRLEHGAAWVFMVLTLTFFSDTGAYFAGRFLGKFWPKKLWPSVSPKKTVIGACGGLLGSILALVIARVSYFPSLSWADCLLIAVPANVLGQLGDLVESLVKRAVGVKDSGRLLPGHGGLLDRVDALLFTAPFVYAYASYIK